MHTNCLDADLNKEYSPSLNIKRFHDYEVPNEKVLENFIQVTKAATDFVRSKYKMRANIRYGNSLLENDNQFVDIYYKNEENETPIFVYIHGGYWQALDRSTSGSFVAPLAEQNYRVILMDYNLCPNVTLEELTSQTGNFFEWLLKYAESTKASKISLAGHSSGAHLLTLLLSRTTALNTHPYFKNIASLFLISGIYDLKELWKLDCTNPDNVLSLNRENLEKLSPLSSKFVNKFQDTLRIHVLVAENDSKTFIEQSRLFANHLIEFGFDVSYRVFENYDHFNIIENVPEENSSINNYLMKNILK